MQLNVSAENNVLAYLAQQLAQNSTKVNDWFAEHWQLTPPALYGSVDIRNAGYKIAPVDMNIFPAGFNNLSPPAIVTAAVQIKHTLGLLAPGIQNIALVPESFTRNLWYWENILVLKKILTQAGFQVKIATLDQTVPRQITLHNQEQLTTAPFSRNANCLTVAEFVPDLILLNNDLTAGIPPILQKITQLILPNPALGWHTRKKSYHFTHYAQLSSELAEILDIDPWLITPFTQASKTVDLLHSIGLAELQEQTEQLLSAIRQKYSAYAIQAIPFVMIKANSGTHGMAIMSIQNSAQLAILNRKQRNNMAKIKNNTPVSQVVIQEGIYTIQNYGLENHAAESVVYLFGTEAIGGFYRVHIKGRHDANLNSPGMYFVPWDSHPPNKQFTTPPQYLAVYHLIAQLSMLATAKETGALI